MMGTKVGSVLIVNACQNCKGDSIHLKKIILRISPREVTAGRWALHKHETFIARESVYPSWSFYNSA